MKSKCVFILILLISNIVVSQPCTNVKELYRKRHNVGGPYGHPYTVFDKHNGKSFIETIVDIRKKLILESKISGDKKGPLFDTYNLLYTNATSTMPPDNGMPNDVVSELALWAKNNAFVFLIGLDSAGNWMDTTAYNGVTGFGKRNGFRDRVYKSTNSLIRVL